MITFEYWDFENGFFVEFQVKYSAKNYEAICSMKFTRSIRIV